ncbi:MAG: DUF86 domain-containing protein [Armatimonadota bacterium]|nr:DUF86 domain-containing protein [Armatimonadota bacterium]MDR7451993.1 DUF86 domain-containing protein [Armatimonadota bacterium]MDR7467884.1 DUF86 domain-containing protein [Armatimonadota bacterium]MDR7494263.1 DUF86 domain-containing protein [Armatimonadota bacterium]MDR7500044.1 DUF86 domain-containing protein [Armatimonadota bacterium]
MPVDRILVTRKIALILEDLKDLEPLRRLPATEFLASRTHRLVAERLLERIIGRMIDINYHLITEVAGLPPKDFYESFVRLAALGVLSPDLAAALAPAAGLRNRLAHEYNEIDYRKIHEAIGRILEQVGPYLEAVRGFVEGLSD